EQQQGKKGHKAGGNLCVKMWTLPEGVRVPISLNTSGLPIGENANMLINFLGALARDGILAPLTYISWKNIPKENKDVMWHIVKLKFDVDRPHELSVLRSIRNKWRVWKSYLKRKHYDSHTTEEERLADRDPRVTKEQWRVLVAYWNTEKAKARSAASKASRAKSTYINKTGSKSFARMRQEEVSYLFVFYLDDLFIHYLNEKTICPCSLCSHDLVTHLLRVQKAQETAMHLPSVQTGGLVHAGIHLGPPPKTCRKGQTRKLRGPNERLEMKSPH
uniref:Uncharacterized protein n=1 Tax=Aegilops tauschii subsp. strangulata TaxID=200361 RepID=A0A453CSB7_AEGTS